MSRRNNWTGTDRDYKNNLDNSVYVICCNLFSSDSETEAFPTDAWIEDYPMEIVLYALVETKDKQRRAPHMTANELANFASTIMEHRDREQIKKARCASRNPTLTTNR